MSGLRNLKHVFVLAFSLAMFLNIAYQHSGLILIRYLEESEWFDCGLLSYLH